MDGCGREKRCSQMMTRIYDLTKDDIFCDLTLVVGEERFNVHKCVLAAASKKFRRMILTDAKCPEDSNGIPTLQLENVSADGIKHLLDYIYCGIEPDSLDMVGLREFKEACREFEFSFTGDQGNRKPDRRGIVSSVESGEDKQCKMLIEVTSISEFQDKDAYKHLDVQCFKSEAVDVPKVMPDIRLAEENVLKGCAESLEEVPNADIFDGAGNSSDQTELVIQILNDEEMSDSGDDGCAVDSDCCDGGADERDDHEQLFSGKENISNSSSTQKGQFPTQANEHNRKSMFVRGLNISALFSAKIREPPELDELTEPTKKKAKLPPPVPDPSLALKRGRPRLPNDHLFPTEPPFLCPHEKCSKVCDTREKLKKHYRNHEEKTHACGQCTKKFLYNKDLVSHLRTHTGEKPYECEICGNKFAQKVTLQYHMKVHEDARMEYSCNECGQNYKTMKGLQQHVKRCHADLDKTAFTPAVAVLQNPCPICAKRFYNHARLLQHIKRQHPNSKEAKSLLQNKKRKKSRHAAKLVETVTPVQTVDFEEDVEISSDVVVESPANVSFCVACEQVFNEQDSYMKHVEDCLGSIQFICKFCGQAFETEKLWSDHIETLHDSKNASSIPLEKETVEESDSNVVTADNLHGVTILDLESML